MTKARLQELLREAYTLGWNQCTKWADRDDLLYDTESPAFLKAQKEDLFGIDLDADTQG